RGLDSADPAGLPRGKGDDILARLHGTRSQPACETAVILMRADDVLNGKAEVDEVAGRSDVDGLEVVKERGAIVPGHPLALADHVVTYEGADGDEGQVLKFEFLGE